MRSIVAESLVIAGALLLSGAGFVLHLAAGCGIAGAVCVLIGVGIIRSQKRSAV